MDVPVPYLINDTRKLDSFKKTTFSNYLKKDVFEALFKKIDEGKIADVCQWTCECIVSGYQEELWERVKNRCLWMMTQGKEFVQGLTNFHWWPKQNASTTR